MTMADETVEATDVAAEPVESAEQTQDAPVTEEVTQDEQHGTDEPEQPTPEPAENAAVEGADPEPDVQAPSVPQFIPVNASQFVDPTSGIFDVDGYNQAMIANQQQTIAASVAQIRAEQEYKGQWDQAMEKYPELKDAKVRDMVAAYHIQQSTAGKYVSPEKAAKQFFDWRDGKAVAAKVEGKREATETTRVQASAHLESTGAPASNSDTVSDLKAQLAASTDNSERNRLSQKILKELVRSNRI